MLMVSIPTKSIISFPMQEKYIRIIHRCKIIKVICAGINMKIYYKNIDDIIIEVGCSRICNAAPQGDMQESQCLVLD